MKKIGILTFHKVINYGAVLQAYALQRKVRDLGFDAELIDYAPQGMVNPSTFSLMDTLIKLLRYLVNPPDLRHLKRRVELLIIKRIEDFLFRKEIEKRQMAFKHFRENYLKVSDVTYQCNNIRSADMVYDGVITGSDQVWNPLITQYDLTYFLNFLNDTNKKISYAASFGSPDNISHEFKEKISTALQDIKYLSVREFSGAQLIKEISNREAQIVLDPVLLLTSDEWDGIIPENGISEPYIFCYAFFNDPEIRHLCKHLSKVTGLKVIRLSLYHDGFQRIKEHLDISTTYVNGSGPVEFLSYLKNASVVVTNSFHGLILSINFRKDFFVVTPRHSKERIIDSLEKYGLHDRLVKDGDPLPGREDIKVNYKKIDDILEKDRNESIEFLKNSLHSF